LIAYSGCRFSYGYNVLKKAKLLKYEISGDIAYINTESLTKHTKQSFVMFFSATFVDELKNFNPSTLGNPTSLKRNLQHGNVSAKTLREWHFNLMRKRART
jgi:intergrase/recombinase